jgi:hypothetical protein
MSKKLHYIKGVAVTVTPNDSAGFGTGYISYTKKTVRQTTAKRHVRTPIYYNNIKYYFLLIFNVTNVTPLLTRALIALSGLRYDVTSCILLAV